MTTRRVLFIDDDESVLSSTSRYFTKLGYRTFTAATGRDGIKKFNHVRPEVTVLDLHMPDISGFNVLEELRPKRPMIIMLTGHGETENAVEAMRRGAENFLVKPIEMAHLEVAVEKAAQKAELNHENVKLRARLRPSSKRKIGRAMVVFALVVGSVGVGLLIGGRREAPRMAPIPVPFDPQDTVIERPDVPFKPFPDPGARDRRGGSR